MQMNYVDYEIYLFDLDPDPMALALKLDLDIVKINVCTQNEVPSPTRYKTDLDTHRQTHRQFQLKLLPTNMCEMVKIIGTSKNLPGFRKFLIDVFQW